MLHCHETGFAGILVSTMKTMETKGVETPLSELAEALVGANSRFEMPVRWGDLDALDHVNNTVYLRYIEEARVNTLRAAGIGGGLNQRNIVVAHVSCDFLRPISWPATLVIDMHIERVGRSSFEYLADISVRGEDSGPCMRSRNIIVGTHSETGRSWPWSRAELEGLARVFATVQA